MGTATFQGPIRSLNGVYSFGPGTTVNINSNVTLDPAVHAGKILRLNKIDAVVTLPLINNTADPNGSGPGADPNTLSNIGIVYNFLVQTATNTVSDIKTQGSDVYLGSVVVANATANIVAASTAGTHFKMSGTTTGGIAGSQFSIVAVDTNKYQISGTLVASGAVATPFS